MVDITSDRLLRETVGALLDAARRAMFVERWFVGMVVQNTSMPREKGLMFRVSGALRDDLEDQGKFAWFK
jgi:hypothetical protein